MEATFSVQIDAWKNGDPIPAKFAFGQPGTDGPFALSDNISPAIRWTDAPEGTRSFAIICYDPDVPSSPEDVNQPDRLVPSDLPRVDFYHWVLVNIPATTTSIAEGEASKGVTPRGKALGETPYGLTGKNDYTGWFTGDSDMEGVYGSYDGPCPPWNDSIMHHYHFDVYALDIEALNLSGDFSGQEALKEMDGHILGKASHMGTYSMNPSVTS